VLQNLSYTYDPVGNITEIRDDAQQTIFFNNAIVLPSNQYVYDALYRLIKAEGREHAGQTNNGSQDRPDLKPHNDFNDSTRMNLSHPHPNDIQAMRWYSQEYQYDSVGNILAMLHRANGGDWTRRYDYAADSNRLRTTNIPNDGNDAQIDIENIATRYFYDEHGSMTRMPHLTQMDWDFKDQLQRVDLGGGGVAYYVYDAAGQRVRKVIERQNGSRQEERLYLGGFEIYRKYDGSGNTVTLERETLHIMDDQQRIALVETKTITNPDDESPTQLIRFQFGNHLGSASLELDDQANVISYEEYYPYGSTSYQAVNKSIKAAAKRYRYTGMERDEETGLSYHGARYYVPWLGRWTSADPSGTVDGLNFYVYSRDNPINLVDRDGRNSTEVDKAEAALIEARGNQNKLVNQLEKALITKGEQEVAIAQREKTIGQIKSDLKDLDKERRLGAGDKSIAGRKEVLETSLAKNENKLASTKANLIATEQKVKQIKAEFKKTANTVKKLEGTVKKLGGDPTLESGDTKYGVADKASHAEAEADDLARKIEVLEGREASSVVKEASTVIKKASTVGKVVKGARGVVKIGGKAALATARIGIKALPILGAGVSLGEAAVHFEEGRYFRAGVDLLEAIPIIGDIVLAIDLSVSLSANVVDHVNEAREAWKDPEVRRVVNKAVDSFTGMDEIKGGMDRMNQEMDRQSRQRR
jgi:RHS repeat-associated protein